MATNQKARLCFDRIIPDAYHPARAVAERSITHTGHILGAAADTIDASGVISPLSIALIRLKMWEHGRTLKCRFLDGTTTQRKKVEAKAHLWEQYANIKFKFVTTEDAEIRVSFSADPGSWSAVGTDALVERFFPKFQPTMNFGWLVDDTSDKEYERVVVHEFGHALGCIHEHQSPGGSLKWNRPQVYRYFSGPPNFWSKAQIDHNVIAKYSKTQTNFSKFDGDSIMLYEFPGFLFTNGKGTKSNTRLSQLDKAFIARMYPKSR